MKSVRKPKPINKVTMCGCDYSWDAKCPGCEYEFVVKKNEEVIECPNCEQEFEMEEYISFYNETH